jgi:glycosyltransferase involved in cell wall biosynthesis
MKILIDIQGAQNGSKLRGIGRYTKSFTEAVVRNKGDHEVSVLLNGMLIESDDDVLLFFRGLLPSQHIHIFHAPGPTFEKDRNNYVRCKISELIRENYINQLNPDIVHICSLFEGYDDNTICSVGCLDTTALVTVTLHDLIPLLNPEHYLKDNDYKSHYDRKIYYLNKAHGLLAVSESAGKEALKYLNIRQDCIYNTLEGVDKKFQALSVEFSGVHQIFHKIGIKKPFLLYTGASDERKNLNRLIQAFAQLRPDIRNGHHIVLAGAMPGHHVKDLKKAAEENGIHSSELIFTGRISDEELVWLYSKCRLYVFPSLHEGFGLPPLEAMACGAAVIGSNVTSIPEVIGLEAALFDPYDVDSITQKINAALTDDSLFSELKENAVVRSRIFSWDKSAKKAISAWEELLHLRNSDVKKDHIDTSEDYIISQIRKEFNAVSPYTLAQTATSLVRNRKSDDKKQLLVDISILNIHDAKSGIQRVVRSILKEWLENSVADFVVKPVFASENHEYCYANSFTHSFANSIEPPFPDSPIDYHEGDIFFGLDLAPKIVYQNKHFIEKLRQSGLKVYFLVYDLLCVQMPQYFNKNNVEEFVKWLDIVASSDGAICISETVANEFSEWVENNAASRTIPFKIGWFHMGSNIDQSLPTKGFGGDSKYIISCLSKLMSFLMVGTIEPRKGHMQVIQAFEILWHEGYDINLVIVGKHGWLIDEVVNTIQKHTEFNSRLFWLDSISDEYLDVIYKECVALIAASHGEGFGLPLIEAAQHGLPLIVRDIPVFKEVAGASATYFSGLSPVNLALAIRTFISDYDEKRIVYSHDLPRLTWRESAKNLLDIITLENFVIFIQPPVTKNNIFLRSRLFDSAFKSSCGEYIGLTLWSSGKSGYLLYGHIGTKLCSGNYVAILHGSVGFGGLDDGALIDVCIKNGQTILMSKDLNSIAEVDNHGNLVLRIEFNLFQTRDDVEIRINVTDWTDVGITYVEIIERVADWSIDSELKSQKNMNCVLKYGDDSTLIRRKWGAHPSFLSACGYRIGRIIISSGGDDFVLYGGNLALPRGIYKARLYGIYYSNNYVDNSYLDVVYNRGSESLFKKNINSGSSVFREGIVEAEFNLPYFIEDLEIRVWIARGAYITVSGIDIRKIN